MVRIAVFDRESCKPKDCATTPNKPCIKYCPRVRTGDKTIVLGADGYPHLNQNLCSGCGMCVQKCPFHCYKIINLPEELDKDLTHKYTPDGFSLYRMLTPSEGNVLGVIGKNGIGKSTAIKILSGNIKMNFGRFGDGAPDWDEIIDYFKGSILQTYFTELKNDDLKIIHKPQEITKLPNIVKGTVKDLLQEINDGDEYDEIVRAMGIQNIVNRKVKVLSGGELQRIALAAAFLRDGDVYLIDEPSSYLDVRERLKMAKIIKNMSNQDKRVIVIEHDLAILDFLSDQVCILYGEPSAYGIISHPQSCRVGINIFLQGYIKDENMRIRDNPIVFHQRPPAQDLWRYSKVILEFNDMKKKLGKFTLEARGGEIHAGEIIGILGPNGIGKTTFINMIAGKLNPDEGEPPKIGDEYGELKIALKPQYIEYPEDKPVFTILQKIRTAGGFDSQYKKRIINGFYLDDLENRTLGDLSGGELQRLAIADCLTDNADIYLLDEPSAFLDVDMRLTMASILRRSIESNKKAAFVVEHDIITQDFISDSLLIFKGRPGIHGKTSSIQDLRSGMNEFLKIMDITFRRDKTTGRPRVNKKGSKLDKMQRKIGEYYYIPKKNEKE